MLQSDAMRTAKMDITHWEDYHGFTRSADLTQMTPRERKTFRAWARRWLDRHAPLDEYYREERENGRITAYFARPS